MGRTQAQTKAGRKKAGISSHSPPATKDITSLSRHVRQDFQQQYRQNSSKEGSSKKASHPVPRHAGQNKCVSTMSMSRRLLLDGRGMGMPKRERERENRRLVEKVAMCACKMCARKKAGGGSGQYIEG